MYTSTGTVHVLGALPVEAEDWQCDGALGSTHFI